MKAYVAAFMLALLALVCAEDASVAMGAHTGWGANCATREGWQQEFIGGSAPVSLRVVASGQLAGKENVQRWLE